MRGIVITLLSVLLFLIVFAIAFGVTATLKAAVRRGRQKREREVPWTHYCRIQRPPGKPVVFEIGVERVTDDGRVLNRTEIRTVPIDDELERLVAENEAELRAKAWNDSKVGI